MFKGLRSFPLKMRIFSALLARAMACATSGALLAIVGVLALCATPVFGQNGSRSWTGNTSTDFYDGDNWSAAGNYPNGNVTFVDSALTGSANTTINRTSGTYSYIYGLYFNNTLNTENIYTINGSTKVFLGGSVVRTSAVTGGSLTDVINANFQQAGAAEVFNLGQNHHLDVNGVISGSNTFTKSGLGTLTLSGTNTYTGNTTISAGTLSVTGAGSLRSGTYAGAIANNGILTLDTSAAQTLSGVISGTGALTKSSTGTLTLSGQNTYTGGTTVNAGTLDLVGQQRIDGALIVDGTGIVKLSGTGHNAYHGISSVTIQNGGTFTDNTTGSRVQSVNSAVTFTNGGTMTSEAGANGLGEFGNFLFISGINVTGTGLATINSSGMSFNYGETVTVADSVAGSGTDLLVSAVIRNERVGTNIKAGVGTMEMTAVNTDTSDWSITGGTLKVGGAGQLQSGSYAGAVANSGTFEYNSSANQTMSGVISGTGALTKSNTGTLTLRNTSANTYTGGTTIDGGIISLGSGGGAETSHQDALGTGTVTVNTGGELRLWIKNNASYTIDNAFTLDGGSIHAEDGIYDVSGNINLAAGGGTLSSKWLTKDPLFSGVISGAGALTIDERAGGNGSIVKLSGTNTYTGNTTIGAGTLSVTSAGSLGSGTYAGAIVNSGTLTFDTSADQTLSGVISGTGALNKSSTGTLALSATNTYTGTTTIGAGTLSITDAGSLGSGTYAGAISNSGTLTFATSAAQTLSGVISGTGALTKSSTGTLTLSGTNTYTGNTTISAGTLSVTGAGSLGSGTYAGAISNSGTLTFATSAAQTLSGVISGTGALTKSNTGTLTLTSGNSYAGGTIVNAGTLKIDVAGRIGNGGLTVNNGGTFSVTNADYNTVPGTITINEGGVVSADSASNNAHNIGALFMNGGTLTSTGAAYSEGNWIFNADVTVGGSALSTISGLKIGSKSGGGTYNVADSVAGAGTDLLVSAAMVEASGGSYLTKTGVGTMTLSGTNTYTGGTNITRGQLRAGSTSAFGSNSAVNVYNLGVLELDGFSNSIGSLTGSTTVENANATAATLTTGGDNTSTTFSGVIQDGTGGGALSLTKTGTGTLTLSGTNTLTGTTTVSAGTLDLTSAGSIGGNLVINNAAATVTGGTHANAVKEALTFSAGNLSPNTLTTNGTFYINDSGTNGSSWSGGTYVWSVSGGMGDSGTNASVGGGDTYNEASGIVGTDWDYISFTGVLDFSAASAGSITIEIDSNGTYTGYDWDKATEVKIVGASSISGFSASYFNLDSSGFDDATGAWWVGWGIASHDNALWLQYKAVPEPGTYVMIFGLVMLPIYHWRKKRKASTTSIK